MTVSDYRPLNPVEMEQQILEATNIVAKSVRPVSDAYNDWQQAELAHKLAYAKAYTSAQGSIEERKQVAALATEDEAQKLIEAEVVYKRLLDYQRSYRDKLSALQSLSKSVVAAYNSQAVGHG